MWHTAHKMQIRTPKGAESCTSRSCNMPLNTPEPDRSSQGFHNVVTTRLSGIVTGTNDEYTTLKGGVHIHNLYFIQ